MVVWCEGERVMDLWSVGTRETIEMLKVHLSSENYQYTVRSGNSRIMRFLLEYRELW